MSEEKKGFRTSKKPNQKEQAQEFLRQLQMMTNVNMQLAQEVRRLGAESNAMAELLRLNVDASKVVEVGDSVMLDHFGRLINEDGSLGESFNGGQGVGYVVQNVGSGVIIKEIEDLIVGKNAGATFETTITFPETYKDKGLVGKKAKFSVRIGNIWKRPEGDSYIYEQINAYRAEQAAKAAPAPIAPAPETTPEAQNGEAKA